MPKRSYPFDTFAPPQMKTHIGQKELSAGVCGESLKREIFGPWSRYKNLPSPTPQFMKPPTPERTKKLLFNGAKAILGNQSNQNKDTDMESPVPELLNGQTTIGQDGKLLKASQTSTPAGGVKACSSCVRSVGDKEACEQCERYICSSCSNTCSCCSAITCSFCTTFVDSDLGEETFCTTCSVYEV